MLTKYVRDTSASQRARAIYRTPSPGSIDSGFGSDFERLRLTESKDQVQKQDQKSQSYAKRSKSRRSSSNERKWFRCDEVTEDYSDADDVYENKRQSTKRQSSFSLDEVALSEIRYIGDLGGGGFAKVDLVEIKRFPGRKYALKRLSKRAARNQEEYLRSEQETLLRARSRFIPRLFQTFETSSHLLLLTEACLGGDLFSVLERNGILPDNVTRYVIACVIEALEHLHETLGVIHRDVKTENILVDSNGIAKLGDLGFCKRLSHNECVETHTFCGTPGYCAPEMLNGGANERFCDFFSTGVVMFECATCRSPFRRQSHRETKRATLRGIDDVTFPPHLGPVTAHAIRSFCANSPNRRLGALGCEEVRRHDNFRSFSWDRLRNGGMKSPLLDLR